MAARNSFGNFSALQLALVIISTFLVFGFPSTLPEVDLAFHTEPLEVDGGGTDARLPWADLHVPPSTPFLPPPPTMHPTATEAKYSARSPASYEISVCALNTCACKNRTKDGEEVIDIYCNCEGSYHVLKIREGMLPELADTLEITDCYRVRLDGMSSGEETEQGGLKVFGRRASKRNNRKLNLQLERRKREAKVIDGDDTEGDEGGGVEWEEAVWEAELGPPDDEEEQDTEDPPEEEEEENFTPEGDESEKGGRYARAAPSSKAPRPLSSLRLRRIRELRMESHAVGAVRSVLLEDVRVIRVFPPYAFQPPPRGPAIHPSGYSQAESPTHGVQWEMESVTFKNISDIEKFSENAFSNVLINSHFHWLRTNVVIMDTNAIRVTFRPMDEDDSVDPCETSYRAGDGQAEEELNVTTSHLENEEQRGAMPNGSVSVELKSTCEVPQEGFTVAESVISTLRKYSFSIVSARTISFDGCHITALVPESIFVGSANSFSFTRNTVLESVSMFAFSVTASFFEFRRNRFGRLEEHAMSGVKPMHSKISSGVPHLTFEENLLMDVDLFSMIPNWDAFMSQNIGTAHDLSGYSYQNNAFADCSCHHLGWIVQLAKEPSPNFYEHLLKDEFGNYCVREPVEPMGLALPCRLPLKGISSLFEEDGITCKRHIDVVKLCKMYQSTASSLMSTYYFQGLFTTTIWATCSILVSYLFWTTT